MPLPIDIGLWQAAFVIEVRKTDGGYYSPASLNCILAGLFSHVNHKFGLNAPIFFLKQRQSSSCMLSR